MNQVLFAYGFGVWLVSFMNLLFLAEKSSIMFHVYIAAFIMVWGLLDSDEVRNGN